MLLWLVMMKSGMRRLSTSNRYAERITTTDQEARNKSIYRSMCTSTRNTIKDQGGLVQKLVLLYGRFKPRLFLCIKREVVQFTLGVEGSRSVTYLAYQLALEHQFNSSTRLINRWQWSIWFIANTQTQLHIPQCKHQSAVDRNIT